MSATVQLREVVRLLRAGHSEEAAVLCEAFLAQDPQSIDGVLLLARIRQQQHRSDEMLQLVRRALDWAPEHLGARFQWVDSLMYCGRWSDARREMQLLEKAAGLDPRSIAQLGQSYTNAAQFDSALRCYRRAVDMAPNDPRALYNLAAGLIAIGKIEEAETVFDRVIELDPDDCDAWHNRSTLRTQTTDRNHVQGLRERLAHFRDQSGETPLAYALAKELEDLGRHEEAFDALRLAARRRRSQLSYRVTDDVATIEHIMRVFNDEYFRRVNRGFETNKPIFVLGLPRSGTTLVDRILSSHSEVASLGEIRDLAMCVIRLAAGGASERSMLVERSSQVEPRVLGSAYAECIQGYGPVEAHLIDKTPLNFLYLGLIHTALPQARIIHVRRNPMDSCFAMYKTLFRAAYPFSYDLDDLASYYVAYHRLMQHWRTVIPHAFMDVDYEELVADQEGVTRKLLTHCSLEWQPACLEFHRNSSPAPTASAAQVRQPMYRTAVRRWKRYEAQLAHLSRRLEQAGIAIEV